MLMERIRHKTATVMSKHTVEVTQTIVIRITAIARSWARDSVSRDFGKFTKIVKKRDMSDHHASQTRARRLNSRVKSRLLPRYELMGWKGDKVNEKCFVFSVIASRTPSFFSPEGERETKVQQVCQNTPNGWYHAPDSSFENAKLRLNIIIIINCSFVNVFIAFNHLYSSVIRTWRG